MTLTHYIKGYLLSLLLTAASFGLVWFHDYAGHTTPTHGQLFWYLVALATAQVLVQLIFFLHIGRRSKTRDLLALGLAGIIIFLVVGGSLWIMASMSHNEPSNPNQILFPGGVSPQNQND